MKSKFARRGILSLVLAIVLGNVNVVRADVAPPEPPSGTNPMPGEELTNVRMMAEMVLIDIDADSPYDEGLATVTATFTMRNLGNVDEQMEVRFPLDQTLGWGTLCSNPFPQFSPIVDLAVKVNGESASTQKTYQTITVPIGEEPYPTITIPCWEHFQVSFPAGKDIIIEVSYTTEPYHDYSTWAYAYVLETGTGWKDTIGTADIIFQVPYELNVSNFYSCWPEDCVRNGNKIQWHYEDFEPTSNVGMSLLPPPLWQRIVLEKENVSRNPNDGEAWGRLARAYKESIMEKRGLGSEEGYRLSKEAYGKAVTLLPNDADWHYGFAELLCINAEWNNYLVDANETAWRECVEQIRQTISINPQHAKGNELLEYVASLGMIDTTGPQPDYLILTPQPTQPVAAATLVKTQAPPATESQRELTKVVEFAHVTKPATSVPATLSPPGTTATPPLARSSNLPLYLGAITFILILLFGVLKLRKG